MSFAFAQPLKILAIGGTLITSTSLWFFNPHVPLQIQTRSQEKGVVRPSNPNLNLLDPVPKLEDINGKTLIDDGIEEQSFMEGQELYKFKLKSNGQEKILHFPLNDLDNLTLGNVLGYKNDYEAFDKSAIKIKLFSRYAWHTSDGNEEFKEPLEEDKINELFEGLNETKTKQLLLSLRKSRKWMVNGVFNPSSTNYYYAGLRQPIHTTTLDGLRDLDIRYFSEFKDLKAYVHKKVKESCKDDNMACIAHKDELDMLDMDRKDFFLNPKNPQPTTPKSSPVQEEDPNINLYEPEDKLPNRTGKVKVDSRIENKTHNSSYLVFNLQGDSIKRSLSKNPFNELDSMDIKNVLGYRSFYEALPKTSIKIHLFKTAAWYSTTGNEEYGEALSEGEIEQLFEGLDETKTKQLLLSLQKRRKWMVIGSPISTSIVYYYNDIHQPQNPYTVDDLKNLEIKYFSDFDSLKDYVHEKVASCTDDTKSCVAHPGELDIMDTDRLEFFQQSQ